ILKNFQASENLSAAFPALTISNVSATLVSNPANLQLNAGYTGTGTNTLFGGTRTLYGPLYNGADLNGGAGNVTAGSNFAVVDITFDVAGVATNGTTTYNNTATATGTAFDNTTVTDNSDNGTAVETGTINQRADDAGEGDPTPIRFGSTVSGTVWNDINNSANNTFTNIFTAGESGSNAGGLNAILVDPITNQVIASVAVAANGTYNFTNVPSFANLQVILSTTAGTVGSAPPAASLPTGWSLTSPGSTNTTGDINTGTYNAGDATRFGAVDDINNDFGIQRLPESAFNLQAQTGNPGGFNSQTVPAGAFQTNNVGVTPNTQDYDGGTVNNIRITSFPTNTNTITINGVRYINGGTCPPATTCTPWPGGGVTVPYTNGTGPSQAISVDPVEGNVDVVIPFVAIDNAGREDPTPGSVTIPFRTISLAGTVWNDLDGNLSLNGAETVVNGTNSGGGILPGATLYANLIDASNNVIARVPVASNGTYNFPNVPQNATGLTVQISTNLGTVGLAKPATALPAGWYNTGENKNGQGGAADATPNGEIVVNTTTTNITLQNFGIQQAPESAVNLQPNSNNPGGTDNVTVPAGAFQTSNVGVNPNTQDYNGGTVNNIRITAFPSNVTSITINGVTYTSGTWPGGGVTIPYTNGVGPTQTITFDPIDGIVTVVIPFVSIDNAGREDATAGSVTIPFITTLPVIISSFTAEKTGSNVLVSWRAEQTSGTAMFEVERSENGISFSTIGQVLPGAGVNNQFRFTDVAPVRNGISYYRLKETERNGNITYTEIRTVRFGDNASISIFPNPVKSYFSIALDETLRGTTIKVELFNAAGQLVQHQVIANATASEQVPVNLPAGNYRVRVSSKTEVLLVNNIQIQ
ncbi:MAG: T9SS type A sorting domain-containing protein, partial [Dinghuibacter sp.]|nr:T9SS type A sorting domain-containing protein [Dinghuibacter sp.]